MELTHVVRGNLSIQLYLSKDLNIFVPTGKCICANFKKYLLIGWACGGIDSCGRGNLSILVTPLLAPCPAPCPRLLSSPGNRATITNYRCRAVQANTMPIPITRQFSRRGKMMSGGLSIRWQLAWLPHHIWGYALPRSSYLILPHFLHSSQICRHCRGQGDKGARDEGTRDKG